MIVGSRVRMIKVDPILINIGLAFDDLIPTATLHVEVT